MKKLLILTVIVSLLSCAKKKIEEKQEELVIQAITTGHWKMSSFVKGGVNITSDFSAYKFKFNSNYTVDAINAGTVERTGTWAANPDEKTITSNFSNAYHPLNLLNGTFDIYTTTWTSVFAGNMYYGEYQEMRMEKL